jgi:Retroviral aspartyl protease
MLMGQGEEEITELDKSASPAGEFESIMAEEAIISLHATRASPLLSTMCFKGYISKLPVCALINNGNTHSFVDPTILQSQQFQIDYTNPLIMMVANEARMITDSKCSSLKFSLQGHEFIGDFRLLQIQGYDLILGLD